MISLIKDNQKYFNRLHVVLDGLVIIATYALAWYVRFQTGFNNDAEFTGVLSTRIYFSTLLYIVPGYLILNYLFGLYTSKRYSSTQRDIANVIKSNTVGMILFIGILYIIRQNHISRSMIFIFYAFNIIGQAGTRILIRKVLRTFRKKGYNIKYILLVGYSRAAEQYIDRIMQNPQWGYVVRGILDDHIPRGTKMLKCLVQ